MTIFGNKDFKEVGLNEVIRVGPTGLLSLQGVMPVFCVSWRTYRGKAISEHSKKVAICETGRGASLENNTDDVLTLDFQPPEP